jgi:hypothetical protein
VRGATRPSNTQIPVKSDLNPLYNNQPQLPYQPFYYCSNDYNILDRQPVSTNYSNDYRTPNTLDWQPVATNYNNGYNTLDHPDSKT